MTLIKSISGIRGTIGGKPGDNLTPIDAVKFAAAFGTWVKSRNGKKVVIGRDARISGEMISTLVTSTLQGLGLDVIDLGLSTTPTVEIAVPLEKAGGGIILTASHNPIQWNALKLLNEKGEFISGDDGAAVLKLAEQEAFDFAEVTKLGKYTQNDTYIKKHIALILKNKLVDVKAIQNAKFKIAVDAVNSTGGIAVPLLLKALGVKKIVGMYTEPNGKFPHNPEPLPENIKAICKKVKAEKCHLGIIVDPDVDRLALVQEDGKPFGEEYTLVAVADYILSKRKGNTVSNLSSTRALRDVTEKRGGTYKAAAVGISKNKIELTPQINVDKVLEEVKKKYAAEKVNTIDGVKIDFEAEKEWVHLRKSNTEPIIRIYAESQNEKKADALAQKIITDIKSIAGL
ncbi:MAG: phosphoglucosamine mutase [Cytophagia bacterium]|nr:phosphoglucosamine mutase [Cytophagia bacterium]